MEIPVEQAEFQLPCHLHSGRTPDSIDADVQDIDTVKAVFRKMSGKLFVFDVTLTDGGHIVGKGSHSRAIVQASRLINEAKKRPKTGN